MIDIQNINGYGIEDPGFALLREVAQKYCPEEFQAERLRVGEQSLGMRKEVFPDEALKVQPDELLDLSKLITPLPQQGGAGGGSIGSGEAFGIGIPETQKLRDLHYEEVDTLNSEQIKRDFPVLNQKVNGHDLVWLDNGATTQKPNQVIDLTPPQTWHS